MGAFDHEHVCRVTTLVGDPAALGGAVTAELCGHWEHAGPCRWPHHTSTSALAADEADGHSVVVTVRFSAPAREVAEVRHRIAAALGRGQLVGPDGRTTTWRLSPEP